MPSRISSTLQSRPIHLPTKQYLDFDTLKELPESYAWGQLDCPQSNKSEVSGPECVPVIDLNDPNALQLIGHACKSWGVFQVVNHGIPKRLLDSIESNAKSLFKLPVEQKLKASRSSNGVTGYGPARISSFFPKRMWSEGFTILGSPLEHARLLWPNDYTKFCDIIEEYQKEMNVLAEKLMWLILSSLGITNQDTKCAVSSNEDDPFRGASGAIQLNSYPACPDPNRAMGLAAHTDSTLLTILHQSNTSGLQVFRDQVGWVTVPPLSGGLIINVGDLLHILSNGNYPSVYHRAVVNRTQHRLSVAYLYGPRSGAYIQPLPQLTNANHPPLYRPVTWSEYLSIKAEHFTKALSLIKLNDKHSDKNTSTNELNTIDKPRSIKVDSDATVLHACA